MGKRGKEEKRRSKENWLQEQKSNPGNSKENNKNIEEILEEFKVADNVRQKILRIFKDKKFLKILATFSSNAHRGESGHYHLPENLLWKYHTPTDKRKETKNFVEYLVRLGILFKSRGKSFGLTPLGREISGIIDPQEIRLLLKDKNGKFKKKKLKSKTPNIQTNKTTKKTVSSKTPEELYQKIFNL